MNGKTILVCPVCGRELHREDKSYFCNGEKRHCFDVSASGHANLCPGRATGGDDKQAVRARTDFLNLGQYAPISDKLCEIIGKLSSEQIIVDAGCGEGYYTNNMAKKCGAVTYGFDLSKEAIISGSKSAKKQKIANTFFFVGGIYDLPVADKSADVITNIFAPCAEEEFTRALKDDGRLILVTAGRDHLRGLKSAIYDTVYANEARADLPKNMQLIEKHELTYFIRLDNADSIRSLFSMTPYSYRTSREGMQKLLALTTLDTEVDVEISVYGKRKEE